MRMDTNSCKRAQAPNDRAICPLLAQQIDRNLPDAEKKMWHAHPAWFLDGNPVVGYSKVKDCVRLLFWSGQSFNESGLCKEGSFKAVEARYTTVDQVDTVKLGRWLAEARDVQWAAGTWPGEWADRSDWSRSAASLPGEWIPVKAPHDNRPQRMVRCAYHH